MKEIKIFKSGPNDALEIRKTVFVDEQGFVDDLEPIDQTATHLVAYIDGKAVGTCRAFRLEGNSFILGRMAVLTEYRNAGIGGALIKEAESEIARMGGEEIIIHAQLHATPFYEFNGYTSFGELEYEQDKPHVSMKKKLRVN